MPVGFLIDRTAEHGDDAVCKDQIYGGQDKTSYNDQNHRIADTALCPGCFIPSKRHADKGTAAVTDHNSNSQCNNRQRKNNGISCVSVRAEVAGVCNKDLINNIVQCTY